MTLSQPQPANAVAITTVTATNAYAPALEGATSRAPMPAARKSPMPAAANPTTHCQATVAMRASG
ncbi:hypothetical protein OHB26_38970 (plasmid) [Nocardia sp. NBC_01503]|uniref:hypothetical protein n=1 Tax=Nocardia sp. NBC_01503 TaxID=2975997 RepID=UPI002E7C2540|nr:hypothetical protein [Nocardia sp. NBC_01503]WTL36662.1 hypothetical protein OHB26_38970 [Nocardia sp. NBC_01503]